MGTIFILEDEDSIRELLEMLFDMEGYSVISTSSIKEFNTMNTSQDVDLYLLDIRLPDGSGIDVCNNLKNNTQTSHIPVVMMSAHAKVYDIDSYCRADAFVAKPFDLDTMLATIFECLADI